MIGMGSSEHNTGEIDAPLATVAPSFIVQNRFSALSRFFYTIVDGFMATFLAKRRKNS